MRKRGFGRSVPAALAAGLTALFAAVALTTPGRSAPRVRLALQQEASGPRYRILAWSPNGMREVMSSYRQLALLPPGSSLWAQVVRRGEEPHLVTSGIRVFYEFPQNRTTRGKSDFWKHVKKLFGVRRREGVGLTGARLRGEMRLVPTPFPHYEATGIPLLPITDRDEWDPYQEAVITVRDARTGSILAQAQAVAPVSDEVSCANCHGDGGIGSGGFHTGTAEGNILKLHDRYHRTRLFRQQPVLCARCHASAEAGTSGRPGIEPLSQAIHTWHGGLAPSRRPACYDCHAGRETQLLRTAIESKRPPAPDDPQCERCHGTLREIGLSQADGRLAWRDEPGCGDCHRGPQMNTGRTLYRHSTGHQRVACAACHGSPHAWFPSQRDDDNWQPLQYQGDPGPLGRDCGVCHTNQPEREEGPHGRDADDDDDMPVRLSRRGAPGAVERCPARATGVPASPASRIRRNG